MSTDEIASFLAACNGPLLRALNTWWEPFALDHQRPPAGCNNGEPWTTWLMIGGRGAGKTRAGAEWVRSIATGDAPHVSPIALIGETEHEVREVMVEGVSGLLAVHPPSERPVWLPSRRRVEWANGAVAQTYSAEDPESLRGPQFAAAWLDELTLVECPAFAMTILHALWTGHDSGINGFANLTGLLMAYFGARFGVLGIYVNGRSREKRAAWGAGGPSPVGQLVNAIVKGR